MFLDTVPSGVHQRAPQYLRISVFAYFIILIFNITASILERVKKPKYINTAFESLYNIDVCSADTDVLSIKFCPKIAETVVDDPR